jgi:hypothetical protein
MAIACSSEYYNSKNDHLRLEDVDKLVTPNSGISQVVIVSPRDPSTYLTGTHHSDVEITHWCLNNQYISMYSDPTTSINYVRGYSETIFNVLTDNGCIYFNLYRDTVKQLSIYNKIKARIV